MNKYKLKKILENHGIYYLDAFRCCEMSKDRDYVRGWLNAVYGIAEKTNIKLYSGAINDLLCRFSNVYNLSELLSKNSQNIIVPSYVVNNEAYLNGYDDARNYIFSNVMK